jgi:hypothetical protein
MRVFQLRQRCCVNAWKDEAVLLGSVPPISQVLPMERLKSLRLQELSVFLWGKARLLLQLSPVRLQEPTFQ